MWLLTSMATRTSLPSNVGSELRRLQSNANRKTAVQNRPPWTSQTLVAICSALSAFAVVRPVASAGASVVGVHSSCRAGGLRRSGAPQRPVPSSTPIAAKLCNLFEPEHRAGDPVSSGRLGDRWATSPGGASRRASKELCIVPPPSVLTEWVPTPTQAVTHVQPARRWS